MKKVVVITGATKGLGLDIYNSLKGYNIATISRNNENYENDNVLMIKGDITNPCDAGILMYKTFEKWGRIDVLINNAGMLGEFRPLTAYPPFEIERLIDLNIKGTFYMTQEAIKLMKEGLIINIGSTRSITGAPNKSIYTMSKFALRGLTQCINAEYNPRIYSTIVCPGNFKTVSTKEIAKIVKMLIKLPKENFVPEIIIGGKL
jgi:NAD(P)-dependent dehydrogenase (short-subunit alcohol dehydrogenase family)